MYNIKSITSFGLPYVGEIANDDDLQNAFSIATEYTNNKEETFNLGCFTFTFKEEFNDALYYDVYIDNTYINNVFFYPYQLYKVGIVSLLDKKWFFRQRHPFDTIGASFSLEGVEDPTIDYEPDIDPDPDPNPPESIKPNSTPPIIQEIGDVIIYQNEKTSLQFNCYDLDGYIKDFYFSLDNGNAFGKFTPSYMGGSLYTNTFLFTEQGEYNCQIRIIDNDGYSANSNTFKITVIPPIVSPSSPPSPPIVSNSDYIILYDKNSKEFESNGLGVLTDCISCKVTIESNSIYELELEYPIGTKFDSFLLDTEYIIKCNVDNYSNSQLFRIYANEYIAEKNIISISARHITYDLESDFVEGFSLPSASCEKAMQAIISNSNGNVSKSFIATSDIATNKSFNVSKKNIIEAIVGAENSVLGRYGNSEAFIVRDNFVFGLNTKKIDRGFVIAYRKNITGFRRIKDISEVVTKIYPYSVNNWGKIITLSEKFIVSPNNSKYVIERIKPVEFNDESIINEFTLRKASKNYFNETNVDMPKINYDINFILLYHSNKDTYNELSVLEKVVIDDIVTIQDERLGIGVKASVIKIQYDVISKKYINIELGNFKNEYRKRIKNEQQKIKQIARGIIN